MCTLDIHATVSSVSYTQNHRSTCLTFVQL
jgi:hypothetical protein